MVTLITDSCTLLPISNVQCHRRSRMRSESSLLLYVPEFLKDCVYRLQQNKMYMKLAAFSGLGVFLVRYGDFSVSLAGLGMLGAYVATGGWKYIWVICNTFGRDLWALYNLIKLRLNLRRYTKNHETIASIFKKVVDRHPEKIAFRIEDKIWTFRQVDEHSNVIARYFQKAGYQPGDTIALYMESRPEFVCFWLGLSKIGVITALINFNLRDQPLLHCIAAAKPRAIIFGGELTQAVESVAGELNSGICYYISANEKNNLNATNLDEALEKDEHGDIVTIPQSFKDKLMFIYTSGTTGLPKAAVITHSRYFFMAYGIKSCLQVRDDDVLYNTLPLYHSAGGILGIGQTLVGGSTCVIRKKFSASRFWDDCVEYKCTVSQYIGEICRYLLVQPNRPAETQHKIRLMFGNGLRPQIWENFQKRFCIEQIGEFYGATEGNCSLINMDNTPGAVGFTTRILPALYPVSLIKVDECTGEPVRDRAGMCVHAEPGEPGQLVGKIVQGDPAREFDGYLNQKETSKKVVANVFRRGDMAFLTGDVLVMDKFGYMYFRDRTGDTFRWKGENVSTSEVEGVISNILKLNDVVVYGVEVPGVEGRAGMAAIVDEEGNINLDTLSENLAMVLPPYARPMFIRRLKAVETTGTFKIRKVDLKKENFDISKVEDKIYYMDVRSGKYKPVTPETYKEICEGKIKL